MSLENLAKIGQLKPHPPEAEEIERLLTAAARNLSRNDNPQNWLLADRLREAIQ